MENNEKLEYEKLRISSLVTLRQGLLVVLTVLFGGIAGLFLMLGFGFAKVILLITGLYFVSVLILSLQRVHGELDSYFRKKGVLNDDK